ncbi:hypothetical protein MJN76_35165, partial [Salmonella enterica subsp. enterica serovar Anatum]|nr:hypothetical protein [Salmonella enterica subsp. enterica serovar Anatum]
RRNNIFQLDAGDIFPAAFNHVAASVDKIEIAILILVTRITGIKRPVYSNGQAVKDDPDFSISLGADGISRKLEIEKGVTDVA